MMKADAMSANPASLTAFLADNRVASGDRDVVIRDILARFPDDAASVRVHDDRTGRVIDLDFRPAPAPAPAPARGRPSLGVTAREVTLLPRHWDWLATQRSGASATLRRLIDQAMTVARTLRQRQDAAYAFMAAACGDRPGFEEALRALYRDDLSEFHGRIAGWPQDIRAYIALLLAED